MSEELAYSLWHRSLGFSYFAMDVDYIEVRNDAPVAVIESSLTTRQNATCEQVFNRFLQETGGFQFELAYWVSRWLDVPAFVVCMNPIVKNKANDGYSLNGTVHILNLLSGEVVTTNVKGYKDFLGALPDTSPLFTEPVQTLPTLLDRLGKDYPAFATYPYFDQKKRERWERNAQMRVQEIDNRVLRSPPQNIDKRTFNVKGETTGKRRKDYEYLRSHLDIEGIFSRTDYFNLNWVEWRKGNASELIGRPAAIIKTIPLTTSTNFAGEAQAAYQQFAATPEFGWWKAVAKQMLVSWHCVVYDLQRADPVVSSTGQFAVWSNGAISSYQHLDINNYADWLKLL
jgi:hypothetical protein